MKTTIRSVSFIGSLFVAMSPALFAEVDTTISSGDAHYVETSSFDSVIPEGATLPAGVGRTRVITRSYMGNQKFDKDGNKKTLADNKQLDILGSALSLDLGITDRVSAMVMVPYIMRNDFKGDGKAAFTGNTGLGDVEVGALYNFFRNDQWFVSAGLGARVATGRYENVDSLSVGQGYNELGLRLNADFQPVSHLWLSVQDQEEMALNEASGKTTKANFFNDNFEARSSKKVLSRKGFAQAAFGLGAVAAPLKAFSIKGRYAYAYDSRVESTIMKTPMGDQKRTTPSSFTQYVGAGAAVDGRAYDVPVALEAYYQVPFAGKDTREVAPTTLDLTLSAYLQI